MYTNHIYIYHTYIKIRWIWPRWIHESQDCWIRQGFALRRGSPWTWAREQHQEEDHRCEGKTMVWGTMGITQKRGVIKCCKMRIKKKLLDQGLGCNLGSKLSQLGQIDWADWLVLLFAVLPDLCSGWWIVRFTLGLPWFHHPLNFRGKCVPQIETRTYVQSNWVSPKRSLEDENNTTQSGEEIS